MLHDGALQTFPLSCVSDIPNNHSPADHPPSLDAADRADLCDLSHLENRR
jgi:hypothetical protein